MKIDGILLAGMQSLGEIDEDRAVIAFVLQFRRAEQDLIDVQRRVQVELNARVVLQHLEADDDFSAQILLLRIDANIQVVKEQIVVRSILPVLAAQDIEARRLARRSRCLGKK